MKIGLGMVKLIFYWARGKWILMKHNCSVMLWVNTGMYLLWKNKAAMKVCIIKHILIFHLEVSILVDIIHEKGSITVSVC